MPRKDSDESRPDGATDAEILGEMEAVSRAVAEYCSAATGNREREERILGIMRLCPQLDQARWREIADRHGLAHWVSFSVDEKNGVDVAHLLQTIRELSSQTDHDALTGLPNRRYLDRAMEIEMERSRRAGVPFCLALIGIDGFQTLRSGRGPEVIEQVLIRLGRQLTRSKRLFDLAAHLHEGEFALMLPGSGLLKSGAMLDRMLEVVRRLEVETHDGSILHLTCSVGISCFKGRKLLEVAELYRLAAAAQDQARAEGGDRLVLAPLPELAALEDEAAQVHPAEKRFLFGER